MLTFVHCADQILFSTSSTPYEILTDNLDNIHVKVGSISYEPGVSN